jgi:hypothetical protein
MDEGYKLIELMLADIQAEQVPSFGLDGLD